MIANVTNSGMSPTLGRSLFGFHPSAFRSSSSVEKRVASEKILLCQCLVTLFNDAELSKYTTRLCYDRLAIYIGLDQKTIDGL